MGVEQYVYHLLHCPSIKVVGEVASSLDLPAPEWINHTVGKDCSVLKESIHKTKLLIKGPCDLEQVFSFIRIVCTTKP